MGYTRDERASEQVVQNTDSMRELREELIHSTHKKVVLSIESLRAPLLVVGMLRFMS